MLHNNETPRLHVVAAGRLETGFENLTEVAGRNRLSIEAGRRAPLANCFGERLWCICHFFHSSDVIPFFSILAANPPKNAIV
jgi:hypothetical protein